MIAVITDHTFDRCFENDYSVDNDVLICELQNALDNGKTVIPVYNDCVECPQELETKCPKVYEVAKQLSERNAVIYNSLVQDPIGRMMESINDKLATIFST